MDPNLLATIITVGGGGIIAAIMAIVKRGKPGLADSTGDPQALVQRVASGKAYGPEALVAMAQMLTELQARIGLMETHERRYLERVNELEQWGKWSVGDPPREVPAWINDPRLPRP